MTITLVVETGSGDNPAANTYVDTADTIQYAAERGITLETADEAVEIKLIKAMDYLVAYDDNWQGDQTFPGVQPLAWPRYPVTLFGYPLDDQTIPVNLRRAQMQLVIELHNGFELTPSTEPGLPVISEKVDVIETKYASPASNQGNDYTQPSFPMVDALLSPLLRIQQFSLRSVRI